MMTTDNRPDGKILRQKAEAIASKNSHNNESKLS